MDQQDRTNMIAIDLVREHLITQMNKNLLQKSEKKMIATGTQFS